jgi:hypothetical protein
MRRILFTIMACTALFVAVPALALAHNGRHHHKRHHHARVRHEKFIGHDRAGDVNGGNSSATSAPTAGKVTSFDGTTLMVTLNNGNTVSGAVTNDTEVRCENPDMQNGDNDDNDGADDRGDAVFHHGDGGGDNGDQGDDNENDQTCTITPGTGVTKAELTINGAGAFWDEVELVSSTTSTTQP